MYYDKKSRRLFLKGAAGLMLSIPILPSLVEQLVGTVEAAEASDAVKAFIFARTYYGIFPMYRHLHDDSGWEVLQESPNVRKKIISKISGHNINEYLGTSLHDQGLEEYATMTFGNTAFHTCDHANAPILASCYGYKKPTNSPKIKRSSIDVLLNEHFKKTISQDLKVVRVRPGGSFAHGFSHNYNQAQDEFTRNSYIDLPSIFHNTFFSSLPVKGGANNQLNQEQVSKKSAMDHVLSEYKRVMRIVSREDKIKLEEYAEEINQVSQRVKHQTIDDQSCFRPTAPSAYADKPKKASEIYKTMNSMIAQSISCGLTKVVCIDMPHSMDIGHSASSFHGASHGGRSRKKDDNTARHLKGVQFARDLIYDLAHKLKNINDTDGKNLLHKSIIFHGSEMGWEHVGDAGCGILMLGKANGKINSGNIFDYRFLNTINNKPMSRISKANGDGAGQNTFGYFGWSTHGSLLESFLQMAGMKRSDYLLPGQIGFGELPERYSYKLSMAKPFHTAAYLSGPPPFLLK